MHTVEVQADADRALGALRAVHGVANVTSADLGDGWLRLTVEANEQVGDLREVISGGMRTSSWPVRELTIESTGLEALFASAVEGAA